MNITELKALADRCICRPARRGIADIMVVGKGLKFLAAQLEDAQGEIRALRATEAGLRESLAELVEAADSMRGTYTFQQGKTPEHEDHYGHEAWAGEFLHERAEAARALLEKKE